LTNKLYKYNINKCVQAGDNYQDST